MALTYNYTIITAVPDRRKGERVNVGVVVFHDDHVDLRLTGISKLHALSHGDWGSYCENAKQCILEIFNSSNSKEDFLNNYGAIEPVLKLSSISWFSTENESEYEGCVQSILRSLVNKSSEERRERATRLNTELSKHLRRANILAKDGEDISSHKVVRGFVVSDEENLVADFAAKNGIYHVIATVDFRKARVSQGETALKSIVLDKACKKFNGHVSTVGLYALDETGECYKPHVEMLKDYANSVYNWLDEDERRTCLRKIYDAMNASKDYRLS